jgi:low temperature requirement protein LtrA
VFSDLGEMVDDLSGDAPHDDLSYWILVFCGFVVLASLKLMYFDANVSDVSLHALRRHRMSGLTWFYAHITLAGGICVFASG